MIINNYFYGIFFIFSSTVMGSSSTSMQTIRVSQVPYQAPRETEEKASLHRTIARLLENAPRSMRLLKEVQEGDENVRIALRNALIEKHIVLFCMYFNTLLKSAALPMPIQSALTAAVMAQANVPVQDDQYVVVACMERKKGDYGYDVWLELWSLKTLLSKRSDKNPLDRQPISLHERDSVHGPSATIVPSVTGQWFMFNTGTSIQLWRVSTAHKLIFEKAIRHPRGNDENDQMIMGELINPQGTQIVVTDKFSSEALLLEIEFLIKQEGTISLDTLRQLTVPRVADFRVGTPACYGPDGQSLYVIDRAENIRVFRMRNGCLSHEKTLENAARYPLRSHKLLPSKMSLLKACGFGETVMFDCCDERYCIPEQVLRILDTKTGCSEDVYSRRVLDQINRFKGASFDSRGRIGLCFDTYEPALLFDNDSKQASLIGVCHLHEGTPDLRQALLSLDGQCILVFGSKHSDIISLSKPLEMLSFEQLIMLCKLDEHKTSLLNEEPYRSLFKTLPEQEGANFRSLAREYLGLRPDTDTADSQ